MKLPRLQTKLQAMTPQQPRLEPKKNWGSGRGGRPWRRLKRDVHVRDNWTCCKCQRVSMNLECDHIVNKAQGGTDDMDNLQSLCKPCHDQKTQQESKQGMMR